MQWEPWKTATHLWCTGENEYANIEGVVKGFHQ